ncbi:IPT/TIG domain-containing protein [Actinoplanes sp. NPDC049118]|uniref:IPT/TIG domain-containing protein n=1 Tax=Actinoplanes sp. NPDC049118 TaxID=3155769 RepID=UPI0033DD33E3
MAPKSRALTRSWLALATAVIATLPAATPALAATSSTPKPLPHVVGGYVPSKVLKSAKTTLGNKVSAFEVLPASVDLRQYAPSPGDQGQVGSCVAWSIAYSIMGYYAKRTGGVGAPYAPLFLYMRNVAAGGAPNAGLNPDAVLANAQSAGVDTQEHYWQGTTNWQTPPTQAQIDNARNYRVNGWNRLFVGGNQGTAAQTLIKQTLASGSPVALGIPVYQDFMYLRSHTLYNTLSGSSLGGHMMAAYGYDADGVYIRNSWGTGWGNGGDAKLSWAFITKIANGAYAVNGIATPAAPIAVAPTVGALSTAKAAAGTAVTISGAGLSTATAVRFGDTTATFTPQTVNGLTKLVAIAPAHALGLVDVTVTNPAGTSAVSTTSKFTYIPPAPAITGLQPSSVSIVGGTTVTLTGTNLTGVTAVKLGTKSAAAKAVTATSLTFVAPVAAAGTVSVTATNAYGTSTPAGQLTYFTPPAPVVASITPSSGPTYKATPVVVRGTDFGGATKVTLGGTTVSFTKVSGTELKLNLPIRPAGSLGLQITTPGGVSTVGSAATFTYVTPQAPAITSITPNSGLTNVKTPIVVNGVNFTDSTKLTVGGVSVSYTKVSATQVKATLPVHAAGATDIRLTTPGGLSATGPAATFTYRAPPVPVISKLSVTKAVLKAATPLTITGTGLTGATKVTVGGKTATFTKVSDTEIKMTVAARTVASEAPIVVTTPGGTSKAAAFSFVAGTASMRVSAYGVIFIGSGLR